MKCQDCGGNHITAYREVRQIVAEMGITKEDITNMIQATVNSLVGAIIKEKIDSHVERAIRDAERGNGYYGNGVNVRDMLRSAVQAEAGKSALKLFDENYEVVIRQKADAEPDKR